MQEIFRSKNLIPCTGCRYCTDGCPKQIAIPELFATMNAKQIHHDWHTDYYYNAVYALPGHKMCIRDRSATAILISIVNITNEPPELRLRGNLRSGDSMELYEIVNRYHIGTNYSLSLIHI